MQLPSSAVPAQQAQRDDAHAIAGLLLAIVLLTTCGALSLFYTRQLAAHEHWVTHTLEVLQSIESLQASLKDAESGQYGYVLTGEQPYRQRYQDAVSALPGHIADLQAMTADNPRQQVRFPVLLQAVRARTDLLHSAVSLRQASGFAAAQAAILSGKGLQIMGEILGVLAAMKAEEQGLLRARAKDAQHSTTLTTGAGMLSAGMGIALVLLAYHLFRRDQHARAQAAAVIFEQREWFRTTLSSIGDAVLVCDGSGRVVFLNPVAQQLTGWQEDAVEQPIEAVFAIFNEHTRQPVESPVSKVLRDGQVVGLANHTVLRARDGREIAIDDSGAPVRDSAGQVQGVVLVFRDVSARRREEELLRERAVLALLTAEVGVALNGVDDLPTMMQRCTELLVKHLPVAFARIWTMDREQAMLELQASAGMYTHLDGPHSRVPVGQFKIGLIAKEGLPHRTNQVPDDPRVGDKEWARREGMVAFVGHPLMLEGRVLGVVAMFARQPLSDTVFQAMAGLADALALGIKRKRGEEDLQKAKEDAEGASRTKSLFLANMSHELRTPLNAVIGYSEMLQEEAQDMGLKRLIPDLQKINGAGRHLLALINDVLDLSKIEAGRMELFFERMEVATLLREVVDMVQPLAEKNGNTLLLPPAEGLGAMRTDLVKLRQSLFNLLANACKFTQSGTITLSAQRETVAGSDWLSFIVSDTGIGMSTAQQERLFLPFSQGDATTTRRFGGTGLCLAISRRFCQMLGGDIAAHSEEGRGSTFTIRLPAEATVPVEADAERPAAPPPDPEQQRRPVVLVIDDDPAARDLMQRFLDREGLRAEVASSAAEGLRRVRELHPVAIILDVMMPGEDGWSVLSALKADPKCHDIPVIMVTMVTDRSRGYALGAAEYLTKPIERERLASVLRRYVCKSPPCPLLLVEDDDASRHLMRAILEQEGWTVTEAENGEVALLRVAEQRPELIILDLMMPQMDGFDFAAALRRRPEWCSIPIVVLTAKDLTAEDRRRLNGYVEKVLMKQGQSRQELLREIRDLVRRCTTV